jgi:hypothetical protein
MIVEQLACQNRRERKRSQSGSDNLVRFIFTDVTSKRRCDDVEERLMKKSGTSHHKSERGCLQQLQSSCSHLHQRSYYHPRSTRVER